MKNHLADRLHEVSLDPHKLPIEALSQGAQEVATRLELRNVPDLLSLVFSKPVDQDFESHFRAEFAAADEAFPQRGQKQLVAVVASEVAIQLMSLDTAVSAWAALAVGSANFRGWSPAHSDVTTIAREAVLRISRSSRAISPIAVPQRKSVELGEVESMGMPAVAQVLQQFDSELTKARSYIRDSINLATSSLDEALAEQIQMMWWLLAGRSWLLDAPLADVESGEAPVLVAIELADLTRGVIGPVAIEGLIEQALSASAHTDSMTLTEMRKGLNESAVMEYTPQFSPEIKEFVPMLAALAGGSATAVRAKHTSSHWALQLYREVLLARTWGSSE